MEYHNEYEYVDRRRKDQEASSLIRATVVQVVNESMAEREEAAEEKMIKFQKYLQTNLQVSLDGLG